MTLNLKMPTLKAFGGTLSKKLLTLGGGGTSGAVSLYLPSQNSFFECSKLYIKALSSPSSKSRVISYIDIADTISETVDMPSYLSGAELYEAIEIKLFDELALEPTEEYIIGYDEISDDSETAGTKKYVAFVAVKRVLEQKLSALSGGYVDFVFTPQTAIKTLFKKNILSDSSTFAFVYIYLDSAFLCVYQDGNLTYQKAIRSSVKTLSERYSEILGERVDGEDFVKILTNSEFRAKRVEYQKGYAELLKEFFTAISDILVHAKRINQISGYEAIYVGTEHGNIAEIVEDAKEYFETPFRNFDFNLGHRSECFADMMSRLMLYAFVEDAYSYENLNFSPFKRPPPLFKRDAGKFMALSTVALIATCAYPLFNFTAANAYYSYEVGKLAKELSKLDSEALAYREQIDSLQKIEQTLRSKISEEEKRLSETKSLLEELAKARSQTKSLTAHMVNISSVASDGKVQFRQFAARIGSDINATDKNRTIDVNKSGKNDSTLVVNIVCSSKSPKDITEFSKKLWESNALHTTTDSIKKDGSLYEGAITIVDENR